MTITIELPSDLNFPNSIEFCSKLDSLEKADRYHIDYSALGNVEPFGMLLIGSRLRKLINDKESESTFFGINYEGNPYAAHMGFYKSVWLNHGNAPGEARGSGTYLPITRLETRELISEAHENREHVVETIEKRARLMANVLSCGHDNIKGVLTYSIREIMRNVLEHSFADSIWFAGQCWPSKDRVEISILDEGVGIFNALKANRNLKFDTTQEALLLAIEPGISGKDVRVEQRRDEVYGNSGYGLFMTSRICQDNGDFIIGSQGHFLGLSERFHRFYPGSLKGTIIRLRLKISNITKIESLLAQYLKEGAQIAKNNKHLEYISASKSSRLLLGNDE